MSFCKTRFHCWVSVNGNGAHTGEGTCQYRCYRRPAVEWNEVHRQSVFVAASMHTIEWRNNYEERTTLVYIVVCGCQTRRSPYETKHAGWTFCFTAELPKVKTPCVTNTPQGVKPFFFKCCWTCDRGLDFFSDPQPSAAFELLLLVTVFVKWPTFILGKFRRGLSSTVAVQGYLDCSQPFTSQLIYQNPAQIQPLPAVLTQLSL